MGPLGQYLGLCVVFEAHIPTKNVRLPPVLPPLWCDYTELHVSGLQETSLH